MYCGNERKAQRGVKKSMSGSILFELRSALSKLNIPIETGAFKDPPPDEYLVLTPITDDLDVFTDNLLDYEVSEVRISLFTKSNYIQRKNQITELLLKSDFTITGRWYVEYEQETGYHHYTIDASKNYKL